MKARKTFQVIYSNIFVKHPAENKFIRLGRLELGSHMTSTVNSAVCQITFVPFKVTSDLVVNVVGSPGFRRIPAKSGNPRLGTERRHSAISVTRVVQHFDLASEFLVNPLAAIITDCVGNILSTEFPILVVSGDVQGSADILLVEPCHKRLAKSARRELIRSGGR